MSINTIYSCVTDVATDFDLELEKNKIVITTRGYGHGVGLSQYGSNELAKSGYAYDKIIIEK